MSESVTVFNAASRTVGVVVRDTIWLQGRDWDSGITSLLVLYQSINITRFQKSGSCERVVTHEISISVTGDSNLLES